MGDSSEATLSLRDAGMPQGTDRQRRLIAPLFERAWAALKGPPREGAGPRFVSASGSADDVAEAPLARALQWQRIESPADPVFEELIAFAHRQSGYWVDTRIAPTSPHDVAQVLRALPPGAHDDAKVLWALRCQGRIVGCLDVMRRWPQRGTVSIGLLLIDGSLRRRGLGAAVMAGLAVRCRTWPGVHRLRAAVVEHHGGALAFWRRNGFVDTGVRHAASGLRAPLVVLERAVPH